MPKIVLIMEMFLKFFILHFLIKHRNVKTTFLQKDETKISLGIFSDKR